MGASSKLLTVGISFAIGAFAIGYSFDTYSKYLKVPFAQCTVNNESGSTTWTTLASVQVGGPGLTTNDFGGGGADGIVVNCGFPESHTFTKAEVTNIQVQVYDGAANNNVSSFACIHGFYNDFFSCGSTATTGTASNTGFYTLTPSVGNWQSTSHFGVVYTFLPGRPNGNGAWSTLKGVYFSDS